MDRKILTVLLSCCLADMLDSTMKHIPVLLNEVLDQFNYLRDAKDGYFADATLGAAGHSIPLAQKFQVIGIDKDKAALEIAQKNIADAGLEKHFILIHDDFKNIKKILSDHNIQMINGALIDLGVSSMQLDQTERGFSFHDPSAPLDMRMDQRQKIDAAYVINHLPQSRLEEIFRHLGEERFAKSIARNISRARKERAIAKVGDLLQILIKSIPAKIRYSKDKHYATNVFRALRIYVNQELEKLDEALIDFVDLLAPGGRLAVITFHSSEDRIVKDTFRQLENPCTCPPDLPTCVCGQKPKVRIITRKPIVPTETEITVNPRSRSAKLRVAEKY